MRIENSLSKPLVANLKPVVFLNGNDKSLEILSQIQVQVSSVFYSLFPLSGLIQYMTIMFPV